MRAGQKYTHVFGKNKYTWMNDFHKIYAWVIEPYHDDAIKILIRLCTISYPILLSWMNITLSFSLIFISWLELWDMISKNKIFCLILLIFCFFLWFKGFVDSFLFVFSTASLVRRGKISPKGEKNTSHLSSF